MAKKVYIIHGWDGHPNEGWFPWLKSELEKKGFQVTIPQLPQPEEPRISRWIPTLIKAVENPDEQTYFVGHSMGCQVIARYLETLPEGIQVGGAVFVAGFFKSLTNIEKNETSQKLTKEWLETSIDLKKIKSKLKGSMAIFSDDDPYVPLDNQEEFRDLLESKIIVEHGKGHFSGSTGTTFLISALDALLEISKQ